MTPQQAVEFLNSLLTVDDLAISSLINNRIPCNRELADHPHVQVTASRSGYLVGMLGILNGIFGTKDDGRGFIRAVYDSDDGDLMYFDVERA